MQDTLSLGDGHLNSLNRKEGGGLVKQKQWV